jgi:hypothetical protein
MKKGGKIYFGLLLSTAALYFTLFGCGNPVQEQQPQNAPVEETDGDGNKPSEGQPETETEKPSGGANEEEKPAEDGNSEAEGIYDNDSKNGSSSNTEENTDTPENPPPITDAVFNFPEIKLRESSAKQGKIVGSFGKITGGVTPFKYGFQTGNGTNDAANNLFAIDENNNGRVEPGGYPPGAPTDPDVPN